jgi:hypothetical protein
MLWTKKRRQGRPYRVRTTSLAAQREYNPRTEQGDDQITIIRIQMRWGEVPEPEGEKGVGGGGALFPTSHFTRPQRKCAPLTQEAPRDLERQRGTATPVGRSQLSLSLLPFVPSGPLATPTGRISAWRPRGRRPESAGAR